MKSRTFLHRKIKNTLNFWQNKTIYSVKSSDGNSIHVHGGEPDRISGTDKLRE